MRQLTHYEIRTLVKNEIQLLFDQLAQEKFIDLRYAEARAKDILKYIDEYKSLPKDD